MRLRGAGAERNIFGSTALILRFPNSGETAGRHIYLGVLLECDHHLLLMGLARIVLGADQIAGQLHPAQLAIEQLALGHNLLQT